MIFAEGFVAKPQTNLKSKEVNKHCLLTHMADHALSHFYHYGEVFIWGHAVGEHGDTAAQRRLGLKVREWGRFACCRTSTLRASGENLKSTDSSMTHLWWNTLKLSVLCDQFKSRIAKTVLVHMIWCHSPHLLLCLYLLLFSPDLSEFNSSNSSLMTRLLHDITVMSWWKRSLCLYVRVGEGVGGWLPECVASIFLSPLITLNVALYLLCCATTGWTLASTIGFIRAYT